MKREMEKSQPGIFPQYLFVFREHKLIGYMFLIAEKENYCKTFPWWAVDNSDELPLEISIQLLEYGILEDQKKGIGRKAENLCR